MSIKPKKCGFKFFLLCGLNGFVHNFEVYTGENYPQLANELNVGVTGNVAVRLCRIMNASNHNELY